MNMFGVLTEEIDDNNNPIVFNELICDHINNICIGVFSTFKRIDTLLIYNRSYMNTDCSIKDLPTKLGRVSIYENKYIENFDDDSYQKKWRFSDQEQKIIIELINTSWNKIKYFIKYLYDYTGNDYYIPENSPYLHSNKIIGSVITF